MNLSAAVRPGEHRWNVVALAAAMNLVLILTAVAPFGLHLYPSALLVTVAAFGGYAALVDARTTTLPDRITVPLAATALIQDGTVAVALHHPTAAGSSIEVAVALFIAYVGLGLLGLVGFGDCKFVVGFGMLAALEAGVVTLYMPPIALIGSAIYRALSGRTSGPAPHGPFLVLAGLAVMVAATS